ncbi:MAG: N-acetyl-gamma-glutamyl-phosphate reductase [Terriglobia bacterium]
METTDATLEEEVLAKSAGSTRRKGTVRAAVAGATGYAGRELITLLGRHPHVRLTHLMSSGRDGKGKRPVEQSHPTLRAKIRLAIEPLNLEALTTSTTDVVFLATPHETSHEVVPELLERGLRVIDLSGAFRLKDASAYPRWYGFGHFAPAALEEAVYGVTELSTEEIRSARLVSNPGCYATSIILALAPLLRSGWVDTAAGIVCDSKSGASGAGRGLSEKLHYVEVNENCRAYGLFTHRHVPEMLQALGLREEGFTFSPHLLPVNRGILSTIYVRLRENRDGAEIEEMFREFYAASSLIRVYEHGALPEIQAVAGTNFTDLGFALDAASRRLIVVSALDNLGKGAAGQAIQNMNLMYNLPEATGLL